MSDFDRDPVLVTGATGKQGGAVADHLLRDGCRVHALTRDPDQPAAVRLSERGAKVVRGDFDDPDSLRRAIAGVGGVFSVQHYWEGTDREVEQGIRVAEIAAEMDVAHLVYASVASCDRETGIPHFESKRRIEDRIRELGIPHTMLRPVAFMQNWEWPPIRDSILSGALRWPLEPDTSLQQISVADIGAVAARVFRNRRNWAGRVQELAGDERTMREIAAAFTRELGREVRYEGVPWRELGGGGDEDTSMLQWFEEEGFTVDIAEVREIHPGFLSFEDYLQRGPWK